jgi:hypothetical protein
MALTSLDEHPNLCEILDILGRVPRLTEREIARLARGWRDNTFLAEARHRALSPDSPLVIDVLAAFDRVDAVFFDDLDDSSEGTLPLVNTALKAIRDALAAAYARPVLTRAEYIALIGPWRRTLPSVDERVAPAGIVTRTAAVEDLLEAFAGLRARCHDARSRDLFDKLVDAASHRDPEAIAVAREAAWTSAVASSRRRQWMLLRQTVHDALNRSCEVCDGPAQTETVETAETVELVRALCADAVCGILMADALETTTMRALVDPAARLLPSPRTPAGD